MSLARVSHKTTQKPFVGYNVPQSKGMRKRVNGWLNIKNEYQMARINEERPFILFLPLWVSLFSCNVAAAEFHVKVIHIEDGDTITLNFWNRI